MNPIVTSKHFDDDSITRRTISDTGIEFAYLGAITYRAVPTQFGLPGGTVKIRTQSGLCRVRKLAREDPLKAL
jgi:hypothetical protein